MLVFLNQAFVVGVTCRENIYNGNDLKREARITATRQSSSFASSELIKQSYHCDLPQDPDSFRLGPRQPPCCDSGQRRTRALPHLGAITTTRIAIEENACQDRRTVRQTRPSFETFINHQPINA